ncbi:hypothetical protein [Marinicella meishanensis]|uniref:hypothetical protein n=1 Tax=Marinicella meishanensis TaxID=2873263 RepID=UPI001CC087B8|nr:hypothetical protein [Marinicella sp. NBU2979]
MNPSSHTDHVVFTPLRIALITAIILANGLAVISQFLGDDPWAQALSVFAVVFIMLFVFVILLEVVWLHHRAKPLADPVLVARYRLAKVIYGVLFVLGFALAAWVLL